jgi:hypothetical protein
VGAAAAESLVSVHHEQDDFYAHELPLHWKNLGGEMTVLYDGPRDVYRALFEDGMELRESGTRIRAIGQDVRAYFHHERFLRQLAPVGY